jgi:methionyl-tRNA formyltransferase
MAQTAITDIITTNTCTTKTATTITGFNPMRIVFMGTPAFALPTLEALHNSEHEVVAVYTQPPRPAKRGQKDTPSPVSVFATKNNLSVFTPASLKTKEVQEQFVAHKADVAVVVAYGLLLPKAILEAYPLGCINVHPSLLPRWRGAAPIQRTIMAGDKETAIVIMQMNEGLDTGDMLLVEKFSIAPGTTSGMLHDTLAAKAGPLVLKTLKNPLKPVPQPETDVTYAQKISKAEARIDWKKPAQEIYQHILGLAPSPGAYFAYTDENIKVFDAAIEQGNKAAPGTVLNDKLLIQCGDGTLRLRILQRPGKKRIGAEELLRGFPIPPGSILN